MKTKLLALGLLAGSSLFARTQFSVGVGFGNGGYVGGSYADGYYAAPPVDYYAGPPAYAVTPPCPGPDYFWTDGYWNTVGRRRVWVNGFWARRPVVRERVYDRGFERRDFDRGRRDFDRDRHFDRDRDGDRRGFAGAFPAARR